MLERVILTILAVLPAAAQITSLSTSYDGSVLYFSSSLIQRGTDQRHHPKVFRWSENRGLEFVAQREREIITNGTNAYSMQSVSASADGKRVGVNLTADCFPTGFGPSGCQSKTLPRTGIQFLVDGTIVAEHHALLAFSPSARYAAITPNTFFLDGPSALIDLDTGVETVPAFRFRSLQVFDDGSIFYAAGSSFGIWRANGDSAAISVPAGWGYPILSPDGATVVRRTFDFHLNARNVSTGEETFLSQISPILPEASFSSNGGTIYFPGPSPYQFSRVNPDGSGRETFTFPREIVSYAVSGDGRLAYVSFADARVVRLDLATRAEAEILPPAPNISKVTGTILPGALLRIVGGGFPTETPVPPYGAEFNGISVDFGTTRGRILSATPGSIVAQLPYATAPEIQACNVVPGDQFLFHVRVWTPSEDPWDSPEVWLRRCTQQRLLISPAAVHDDGTEVTVANPARAGEVLRLFATGTDMPAEPQEDGVPAPADPIVLSTRPYPCGELQVNPVHLAPGLVGIYTVSLRVPANPSDRMFACFAGISLPAAP